MNNKLAALLIGLILLFTILMPPTPYTDQVAETPAFDDEPENSKVGEATSGLGASIPLTYEVLDKVYDRKTAHHVDYVPDRYWWSYPASYTYAVDGDVHAYYSVYTAADDIQNPQVVLYFEFDSPYTDLEKIDYKLKHIIYCNNATAINSQFVKIRVFTETGYTEATGMTSNDTYYDSAFTLTSSHVVDSVVYVQIIFEASTETTAEITQMGVLFDEFVIEYDPVTEVRRAHFSVKGGTLRYVVDWTTWDYSVNTTLTVPGDWVFQDVNPDCSQTSDEFKCLVPEDYEAIYSCPVIATSNWELVHSESFESGVPLGYGEYLFFFSTSEPPDSATEEYTIVADGGVSCNLTNTVSEGKMSLRLPTYFLDNPIFFTAQFYEPTGSNIKLSYKVDGAWTSIFATGKDKWETISFYAEDLDNTDVIFNAHAAGSITYFDAIQIYNSSVSTGATITGQCNHIFPNGYTPASFVDVELGLWDASYNWVAYDSVTTNVDGEWSYAASSFGTLSAQGYHLITWGYYSQNGEWDCDAKTESVTDWKAEGNDTFETEQLSTDAQEGMYSVELITGFDGGTATDWSSAYYNPTATFDTSGIMTMWFKLNDTTDVEGYRKRISDSSARHSIKYHIQNNYDFAVDTWTYFALPHTENYNNLFTSGFDATVTNLAGIYFNNATSYPNNRVYSIKIDSFNFIHYYTTDTLTYPFSLPSDWELQGLFSEGDVYNFYDYTTNYDASYAVYENDSQVSTGSITQTSGSFHWTKDTGIAIYEVGVKFTISGYTGQIWKNWSYTVGAGQTWLHLVFTDYDGYRIPWGSECIWTVLVDSEEVGDSIVSVNASDTVNVTVTDKWGVIIFQNTAFPTTASTNTYLKESLLVYEVFLNNQKLFKCFCGVTREGTGVTKYFPGDFTCHLYNDTYIFQWYEADTLQPIGDAQTVDVTAFTTIYTARQPIEREPGAGSDNATIDALYNLQLQNFLLSEGLIIIGGLVIVLIIGLFMVYALLSGKISEHIGGRRR